MYSLVIFDFLPQGFQDVRGNVSPPRLCVNHQQNDPAIGELVEIDYPHTATLAGFQRTLRQPPEPGTTSPASE
jgi:hypothetical protein